MKFWYFDTLGIIEFEVMTFQDYIILELCDSDNVPSGFQVSGFHT
jgi:hypothetical protein